jgi:anti-sigma factor RsiW
MTTDSGPIREDDLHAYVDGFLDSNRRAFVDRYLADHPDAARRVSTWQKEAQMLRDALAWKAEEPVPATLNTSRLLEARLANRWGRWRMAAGIVLALAVGGGSGWMLRGPSVPTGVASVGVEAAAAYRVFATDEQHPVEFGPEQRAQMVTWATRRLGRPIAPPDLTKAGFQFIGGRPIATTRGPACMFLYESSNGMRVAVFVRPMNRRDMTAPMRPTHDIDTDGYAWAHNGLGFGVVAGGAVASLHELSNSVRDEMNQQI